MSTDFAANDDSIIDATTDTPNAATPAPTPTEQEPAEPASANREAAKYRRQLRTAEQERDTATTERDTARLELLHTKIPGLNLEPRLKLHPDAIAQAFNTAAGFYTPDGHLDATAVTNHLEQLRDTAPYMFESAHPAPRLIIESEAGTSTHAGNPARSFAQGFNVKRDRD
ncbi:hypothetical protein [Leucobacter musarum]|uniref:hypothetical protein n=1 Tax=Leucobacter musarum TaxID=1930747 RepID=UPI0006A7E5E8|nr:hypothetical protein [Leucobacter musarum]